MADRQLRTRAKGSDESLAQTVGEMLVNGRLKLAVAESCTGGLLGGAITIVPGSSAYFEGGVIAYSYEAKMRLLGVPAQILEEYGAVSPATAKYMANSVRQSIGADLGLAITGIAGPAGATPAKPVGLVYIALSSQQGTDCREFRWSGNRQENREWSVRAALQMLHQYLLSPHPSAEMGNRPDANVLPCDASEPPTSDHCREASTECRPVRGRNLRGEGKPIQVRAYFEPKRPPLPLAFKVQGQWLDVASVGRTWSTGEGREAIHHYTVDTASGAIFELAFDPEQMRWLLVRSPRRQATV